MVKAPLTGDLIDRLDQLLNLHSKPSLSKIYHKWWLSRDNPNCNVVSELITTLITIGLQKITCQSFFRYNIQTKSIVD
ncbi:MAG: hypothetical protein E6L01_00765 [Thaumarchaeota archaeon]|nr:MAG: hypothetical protein E6L01_00765 [Nitrososphaerota archaeon]